MSLGYVVNTGLISFRLVQYGSTMLWRAVSYFILEQLRPWAKCRYSECVDCSRAHPRQGDPQPQVDFPLAGPVLTGGDADYAATPDNGWLLVWTTPACRSRSKTRLHSGPV